MNTIEERLRKIVSDHLGIEPSKVTPDARIVADLGGDSLDVVEIEMACEDEWDIDNLEAGPTVATLLEAIRLKVDGFNPSGSGPTEIGLRS